MTKGILIKIGIISGIAFLGFFGYRYVNTPNLKSIEVESSYSQSEISYRYNYTDLVEKDKESSNEFLLGEAEYSIIYSNFFPFESRKLDKEESVELLVILNDSSNYSWGEWGTPKYSKTIVYFNANDEEIGYTKWEPLGEADSFPYRSLMKWGMISNNGDKKLREIIENGG
jgi:hypothetical protein